jgi:hypothetical protein
MILGLSTHAFTVLHVVLSLVGIASGVVVVFGMFGARRLPWWTTIFLATTVLTGVTGFLFPSTSFGPPHVVGVISLVVLAAAIPALYVFRLAGAWRWIYVETAILALYLNVFIGVVQAFQKISFLQPLAPTQSEPPFVIAQAIVLAVFVLLAVAAAFRFHPSAAVTA